MLIIINPFAAEYTALIKWKILENSLFFDKHSCKMHFVNGKKPSHQIIKKALNNGEREFIAAGGDGTVNYLLNSLIKYSKFEIQREIKIGAIGIGSSNDFHKPFTSLKRDQIPIKINFEEAKLRDVGYLKFTNDEKSITKYFLINASIGLTADANNLFNNPDKILRRLKQNNTALSIYYAALKTILSYRNLSAELDCNIKGKSKTKITNLGIVKSPYFSGDLRYNSSINFDNGFIDVHLCENLSKANSLFLLWALGHNKLNKVSKLKSWKTNQFSVSADKPFTVEYDGETIKTKAVEFGILKKQINVCIS